MKRKLTKKYKIAGALSVLSLLAALLAPQVVGVVEVVRQATLSTDCFGACLEEEQDND